ncbi:MAG: hypothetical protein RLZZ293_1309 [Pseudomonadota bacterium]|jgi:putative aldouronate transport system permease protein
MTKHGRDVLSISNLANFWLNLIIGSLAFICIYPLIFIFMISISSPDSIVTNGYRMIPSSLDFGAYHYLFKVGHQILQSYWITVVVTILGTLLSVFLTVTYAYAISRDDFKFKRLFTWIAVFPMLFSGGLVPFFMISVQVLHFYNSLSGLIIPLALNSFFILIMRTYFKSSAIRSLVEAARIDGANEFIILIRIVLPLSLPGIATIALFSALSYWGDWYNALLFVDQPDLTPIQAMLMNIQNSMTFIAQNSTSLSASSVDIIKNLPTETARMAIVILATVPILLAYPFFQRFFIQGLTVGGVKE